MCVHPRIIGCRGLYVGSEDLAANHRVKQIVEVLEPAAKDRRLLEVMFALPLCTQGSDRACVKPAGIAP